MQMNRLPWILLAFAILAGSSGAIVQGVMYTRLQNKITKMLESQKAAYETEIAALQQQAERNREAALAWETERQKITESGQKTQIVYRTIREALPEDERIPAARNALAAQLERLRQQQSAARSGGNKTDTARPPRPATR
ncbi:MAG: hypothetical protein AAF975_00635 [Spirochaetota bacterium]